MTSPGSVAAPGSVPVADLFSDTAGSGGDAAVFASLFGDSGAGLGRRPPRPHRPAHPPKPAHHGPRSPAHPPHPGRPRHHGHPHAAGSLPAGSPATPSLDSGSGGGSSSSSGGSGSGDGSALTANRGSGGGSAADTASSSGPRARVTPTNGNAVFPTGPVVDATREAGPQSEVSIAVNPKNPRQIFIGTNDITQVVGMTASVSSDGGATFSSRVIGNGLDGLPPALSDPAVAWDSFGNLYYSYVAGDTAGNPTNVDPILMSTDGGATFQSVAGFTDPNAILLDQESIAVGPGPGGQGQALWIAATDFLNDGSAFQVVARLPILGPGRVGALGPSQLLPGTSGTSFNSIAVGPKGQVSLLYQDEPNPGPPASGRLLASENPTGLDGGFGSPVMLASLPTAVFFGTSKTGPGIPAEPARGITMKGGVAWDTSAGPHHGRLYAIYTNTPATGNVGSNIFLQHSDNGGQTWSAPAQVNDDQSGNSHFWPRVAVDPTTGYVAASWYDDRNDNGSGGPGDTDSIPNDEPEFYAGVSIDGGASFLPNFQLQTKPSNAITNETAAGDLNDFGDYTGLVFDQGFMHPAWTDNSAAIAGQNPNPTTMDAATITIRVPVILAQSDVFEPNETSDMAHDFHTLPPGVLEALLNLTVATHSNGLPDYDWFRWSAGGSGTLSVTFSTKVTSAPLEVRLFTVDANNTLVELGSTTSSGNTISQGSNTMTVVVAKHEPILIEVKGMNVAPGVFGNGTYNVELGIT